MSEDSLRSLFARSNRRVKVLTNVFLFDSAGRVLLGKKLRGWMEGIYNGFGGKLEPGERVREAAQRELQEEACVRASSLSKVGTFWQTFDDKPGEELEVHVFRTTEWVGTPQETDEMRPEWFEIDDIPYNNMWADDLIWYPFLLNGKCFKGRCHFGSSKDFTEMKWHNFQECAEAPADEQH